MEPQDMTMLLQSMQDRLGQAGSPLREQAAFVRTLHDEVVRYRAGALPRSSDVASLEAQLDEEVSRLIVMLEDAADDVGVRKAPPRPAPAVRRRVAS